MSVPKVITIEITTRHDTPSMSVIHPGDAGTQYDHNQQRLSFIRPAQWAAYDLVLFFMDGFGNAWRENIGVSNEYLIPNALTQTRNLNLQIAFALGDTYRAGTNAIELYYRAGAQGGGTPDPMPDIIATLENKAFADGEYDKDRRGLVFLNVAGSEAGFIPFEGDEWLWLPTVSPAGLLSWERSISKTPPMPQNIKGTPGKDGEDGATGPQGPPGNVGPAGPQGVPGVQGPQGPQGPQGNNGAQGPQGDPGPQGPAGNDGAQGPPGADGATGATGPAGPQGDPGVQGPIGPSGSDGAPGKDGKDGAPGKDGEDGAPGKDGEDGAPGKSALTLSSIWTTLPVQGGQGTIPLAAFNRTPEIAEVFILYANIAATGKSYQALCSVLSFASPVLVTVGYTKVFETTGATGASGTDGTDGTDGYTPVRGTDYWTTADQSAIVSDVLAALPDGDTEEY